MHPLIVRHRRAIAYAALATLGAAWLTQEPLATRYALEFWNEEATTQPTYAYLIVACGIYALVLRLLRRYPLYDRLLWLVVMGGVIIVGLFAWWRFQLPLPVLAAHDLTRWSWRVMTYHFYAAALPIVIWQMAQDYVERRRVQEFRNGGGTP